MPKLMMVPYIRRPPIIDMTMAGYTMSWEWASMTGNATHISECNLLNGRLCLIPMPMTTRKPVQNLPKSRTAFPLPSAPKSSGFAHRPAIQLGTGFVSPDFWSEACITYLVLGHMSRPLEAADILNIMRMIE